MGEDITLEDKKPEILKAVEFAKSKGATGLKVELEATLQRFSPPQNLDRCQECHEGTVSCDECEEGSITCPNDRCDEGSVYNEASGMYESCDEDCDEGYIRCDNCEWGRVTCAECEGDYLHGQIIRSWDDQTCLDFMLREKLGINYTREPEWHSNMYHRTPACDWLQFAKFYNDGSVDSEITFTVSLENPENVLKVVDMIRAFTTLAEEIGNGINVDGAGMHTAWLFTENANYPHHYFEEYREEMVNFRLAMNQMMPALYFLAAPANGKNWTRGFRYREPSVDISDGKSYSAINWASGAMEFRVFDTCYDTPEQFLDNMVVMSNSLKYFSKKYVGPRLFEKIGTYRFGHDNSRTLDRLYYEENNLDLLYEHIDKLKPKYYTMTQLRKQRGFTVTKSAIKKRKDEIKRNAQLAWEEYQDRWKIVFGIRAEEARYTFMRRYVESADLNTIKGMSDEQIREAIEAQVENFIEQERDRSTPMEDFIASHEHSQQQEIKSAYNVYLR